MIATTIDLLMLEILHDEIVPVGMIIGSGLHHVKWTCIHIIAIQCMRMVSLHDTVSMHPGERVVTMMLTSMRIHEESTFIVLILVAVPIHEGVERSMMRHHELVADEWCLIGWRYVVASASFWRIRGCTHGLNLSTTSRAKLWAIQKQSHVVVDSKMEEIIWVRSLSPSPAVRYPTKRQGRMKRMACLKSSSHCSMVSPCLTVPRSIFFR